ncbi:MAG: hypothetical protein ABJA93_12890 [Sporichthyaceae bacterium]
MLPIPEPFIQSELDFHRERITEHFAAAELRRRNRVARRRDRKSRALQRSPRHQVAQAR